MFGSASEAGQLDNIARRFAWFRRVLQSHEMDNGALFPRSWNVGAVLAGGFTEVTRYEIVLQRASLTLAPGTTCKLYWPSLLLRCRFHFC